MNDELRLAIERWATLVHEIADHSLDHLRYAELINTRNRIEVMLKVAGDEQLRDLVNDIDVYFSDITIDVNDSPFADSEPVGWWAGPVAGTDHWWVSTLNCSTLDMQNEQRCAKEGPT